MTVGKLKKKLNQCLRKSSSKGQQNSSRAPKNSSRGQTENGKENSDPNGSQGLVCCRVRVKPQFCDDLLISEWSMARKAWVNVKQVSKDVHSTNYAAETMLMLALPR